MLLFLGGILNAQNYLHVNITEIQDWMTYKYCTSQYDGIVLEKEIGCEDECHWIVQIINGETTNYTTDEIILLPLDHSYYHITYTTPWCSINWREFDVKSINFQLNEPFTQDYIWKRSETSTTLNAYSGEGYSYQWSTGSMNSTITVTQPGTYWVRIFNDCGELSDTIKVCNNVEIDLATCDLETNLNIVTWPTNPAQAEYVGQVVIKRDGIQVGTANYADGYFLDNIGSDAASRTYTLTAIATDGTECPIVSYPKETIHMAYLTGINNTIEVNWNVPAGYDLLGYNICEWHEDDGSLTVIDYVGASVTSYTCSESQFDEGYIVVQGVEAGKNGETRLLSNRSLDLVGLGENEATAFKVYPNPAKGRFTIEGTGKLTVTNTLGQTILTREIEGKEIVELPRGMYFVKLGGMTRKIVVE
ncbi:MAG: T9SS type A sorting domain-containing protein [Bacteroidales bacterium]|nr:T9SS type A sorting domain-containing protein [Bacteroidales bacterium]